MRFFVPVRVAYAAAFIGVSVLAVCAKPVTAGLLPMGIYPTIDPDDPRANEVVAYVLEDTIRTYYTLDKELLCSPKWTDACIQAKSAVERMMRRLRSFTGVHVLATECGPPVQ